MSILEAVYTNSGGSKSILPIAVDASGNMQIGAARIAARGATISTGASSATTAIPNTSSGVAPNRVRLASTAACYARLGAPSEGSAVIAAAGSGYAPADTVTLTGGTFSSAMILNVATTRLISAAVNAAGSGYVPADTITAAGGTFSTAGVLTVATTKVSATPGIVNAGTAGTPGAAVVTGTTGTGTKFQANVTIAAGGTISSVNSIAVAGSYTANPVNIADEPVTGGGLVGARLSVVMGVNTVTVSTPGSYTVQPTTLTQSATSGAGTGATFNTALFGVNTVTVSDPGSYTVEPSNPVAQGSTSGGGTAATFTVTWATAAAAGDMLIQPGDSVIVDAIGYDHVAAIQVSGAGVLQVSPIEN